MRLALKVLLAGLLLALALAPAGCNSGSRAWVEPQDHKVTIASPARFVRTEGGDYVDGYLADYEWEFQKQRMFMVLEIPRYRQGDRLIVTGRFTGDSVRMPSGGPLETVRVFEVERAAPNVPVAPNIPAIK